MLLEIVGVPQVLVRYVVLGCTRVTVDVKLPSMGSSVAVLCESSNLTVNVIVVADPAAALALTLIETKFVV